MTQFIIPSHEPPDGVQPLVFHSTVGPVLFALVEDETAQAIGRSAALEAYPGTSFLNLIDARTPDALIDQLDGAPVGTVASDSQLIVAIEGEDLFEVLYAEFLEEAGVADARSDAYDIGPASAVLYNRANRHYQAQEYPEAIAAYGRVIVREPEFALAYVNRGLARSRYGDPDGGLDDLYAAATLGAHTPEWFPEVLADEILVLRGFVGLWESLEDSAIDAPIRLELKAVFEQRLNGPAASDGGDFGDAGRRLVGEMPELGIEFDPRSMRYRCLIADVFRARLEISDRTDLLGELYSVPLDDCESAIAWRLAYAQAAIPYSIISADLERSYQAHTLVIDEDSFREHFTIDDAADLERIIADAGGIGTEGSVRDRLAHAALDRFAVAAALLRRSLVEAPVPAATSAAHWRLCEHLLKGYALTANVVGDFDQLANSIDAMRQVSMLLGMARNDLDPETLGMADAPPDTMPAIVRASRGGAVLSLFTYETGFENIGLMSVVDGHPEATTTSITPADLIPILKAGVGWIDDRQRADLPWKLQLLLRDAGVPQFDYPAALSDAVLPSVRDAIADLGSVVFIPYGYLHNLPLHLLGDIREAVLGSPDLEVVYAPSALRPADRAAPRSGVPSDPRAILIATSDANYAVEHKALRAVTEEYDLLVDPSVTQVQRVLSQYHIVHFACHGGFDPQRRSSYLMLGGERLYAKHVFAASDDPPWLVFINACVSGNALLEGRSADQTIGLHTALLGAGVDHVIGALWSITEAEAGEFAKHLYGLVVDEGRPIRRAWVDAQRLVRDRVGSDDLYRWGGHALYSTIP